MVSGTLAKKTLGDGSKTGLFYTLIREHGPAEAARYVYTVAITSQYYITRTQLHSYA
jgi:DNA-directed RNA polymerase III subunit RPC1